MTREIKEFIEQNKSFIEEGNMRGLYIECDHYLRSELTEALLKAGIDCTEGMAVIPPQFAESIDDIQSFSVPEGVVRIGECAFANCENMLSISLPNTLKSMGVEALAYCESLTEIIIPDSVTEIEDSCFSGCTNVEKIVLSKQLTYISCSMFDCCYKLRDLIIPCSVTRIELLAFARCSALVTLYYEGTIKQWNNIEKFDRWDDFAEISRIVCSDGVIEL